MKIAYSEVVHTVKCAICKKQKQKSNGWWEASVVLSGDHLGPRLILKPMDIQFNNTDTYYLCGAGCVNSMTQEFMTEVQEKTHAREESKDVATESVGAANHNPSESPGQDIPDPFVSRGDV